MPENIDRKALYDIGYGLYIVSSSHEDKLNGQIVNTVFQVTSDPPRIAIAVHKDNLTHEFIKGSGAFSVSILDQETPFPFIGTFGFKSGRDIDKLSQCSHRIGETGAPIVTENALSIIEAKVISDMDLGSHTLFVADIVACEALKKGVALTYKHYQTVKKGKSPKNAPTYVKPS